MAEIFVEKSYIGMEKVTTANEISISEDKLGNKQNNWQIYTIKNLCTLIKDGTHTPPKRVEKGIPLLSAICINKGRIDFEENITYITEKDYKYIHKNYSILKGDLLLTIVGTIGRVAIVSTENKFSIQRSIALLRPDSQKVTESFFYYALSSTQTKSQFLRSMNTTAQSGLYLGELEKIKISTPSLSEQEKITAILNTVDEAIEKTEAIIAQIEFLKKGLMQEIFTKRILKEDVGDKKNGILLTPSNMVPIKWYIKRMKSGLSRKISSYDIGLPVVTSNNIQSEKLDCSELRYWYEKDPQGANTADYILNDGDILLNFINSTKQIGKCCIFKDIGRKTIYTTNIFRIEINPEKTNSQFLSYLINSQPVQKEIKNITKPAINQASFTKPDFESIKVPRVTLKEQQKIVLVLNSVDEKLEIERKELEQLKTLKNGLMQDLLTGRVRVEVGINA